MCLQGNQVYVFHDIFLPCGTKQSITCYNTSMKPGKRTGLPGLRGVRFLLIPTQVLDRALVGVLAQGLSRRIPLGPDHAPWALTGRAFMRLLEIRKRCSARYSIVMRRSWLPRTSGAQRANHPRGGRETSVRRCRALDRSRQPAWMPAGAGCAYLREQRGIHAQGAYFSPVGQRVSLVPAL